MDDVPVKDDPDWLIIGCTASIEQLNYKNLTEVIAVIDNFEQFHSTAFAFEVNTMISTT